ncbi:MULTISPECIES: hypothetical protein [Trichocoleus]|uniref:Uncharacterized protein n=1 Tax=Trichocoleus desertorum GB2-A4 TaxID=2933944 RepID=A0ABV0J1W0_9CYAN|nr:hypothetical protein [Trichocoleus sp. FACHB-46]MBD1860277.1 hypothetical protein [Trichocoleus sp. FACHB-46]
MGLKVLEHFDGSFELEPAAQESLFNLLQSEAFLQQVSQQSQCQQVEFTKLLFQPVPYSTSTPKGMPHEFEKYHGSNNYVIVNVPPNFMFNAKIFRPSRLCAVYHKLG